MSDERSRDFQKKLAIYQIAATAGTTLGSIIIAMGISLIILSTDLSFESVSEDSAKSQFYRVMSSGYFNQGLITFFAGLTILVSSVITISKTIKHLEDPFSNKFTRQEKKYQMRLLAYGIIGLVLGIYFVYTPEIIVPDQNRWQAVVGSMAVVATLIVGDTHRHYQNKQNQTTSLFKIFELISSPDIRKSREIIHNEYCRLKKNSDRIEFKNTDNIPDLKDRIDNVLSAFDQVSATVLNGLIDEELFFDTYGEMIVRDWKTMKTEIQERQRHNKKTLRHFTILKNRFENRVELNDIEPYCKD